MVADIMKIYFYFETELTGFSGFSIAYKIREEEREVKVLVLLFFPEQTGHGASFF